MVAERFIESSQCLGLRLGSYGWPGLRDFSGCRFSRVCEDDEEFRLGLD